MNFPRSIVIGGALLACLTAGACGSDPQASPVAPTPTPSTGTFYIDIAEINGPNSFYPSPVSVDPGRAVVWRNGDRTTHHVVFDQLPLDTGTLAAGTSSQPVTVAAGTWSYHCAIHPQMTGVLTVTGTAPEAPATGY